MNDHNNSVLEKIRVLKEMEENGEERQQGFFVCLFFFFFFFFFFFGKSFEVELKSIKSEKGRKTARKRIKW